MQYWYVFIHETLLSGRGNVIERVIRERDWLMAIAPELQAQQPPTSIPPEFYRATLTAAFAARFFEGTTLAPTPFASVQQVFRLFAGVSPSSAALQILNAQTLAAEPMDRSSASILARIRNGFSRGELFYPPRDTAKLREAALQRKLPGALAQLVAQDQAKSAAFSRYLRRGRAPEVTAEERAALARQRPVLPTSAREARLLREAADDA